MAPDDPKTWLWLISFAVFVPPTVAELPMSLKNLAVDNVIIAECSDPARLRMFEGKQHCSFEPGGRTVCFRGLDTRRTLHSQGRFNRTKELILCDWPTQRFDPRELAELVPNVEKFAITGERMWMLKYDFPPLMNLWAINITGTKLNQTRASSFQRLPALRQLNMRGNALVEIVPFVFRSAHVDIYLQGNPWNCTNDMIWLLEERSGFYADKSLLVCKDWKYTGRPMVTAMEYKRVLREHCRSHEEIRNCTCRISYLRLSDSGKAFQPMVTVNCTGKEFYRLPSYLPPNTTVLHVANNRITEVELLTRVEMYMQVKDIYLDNNNITSIDILEDSEWLDNFRILSLRGNQIKRIRVYTMEHALQRNAHVGMLFLSDNPWRCGCRFATRMQEFLRKHESVVVDSRNITCYTLNDEGHKSFLPVMTLTPNDVCRETEDNRAAIYDVMSIVFASLIALIFTKLAYDYYIYRKYGKLPWLIMKMP
ncbi:protein singed wings 2 isoform X2 [Culex pipiens pallens]|uniref:protein singed wings 2 isoform X2 n=1 Tax=Culex pipiens pallens TaxID=42434 RepID=UPI001953571A|nr:protein singed wings 2 isoform X2 [Culex pipiens pallens]